MTPGPNFLFIAHTASSSSRRVALWAATGVATGSTVLATMGALGAGAALGHGGLVDRALRIACAGYLAYIGYRVIRRRHELLPAGPTGPAGSPSRAYLSGTITVITNPKGLLFFGVVLTAMVPSTTSLHVQAAIVACIGATSLCWHATLAVMFSSAVCRKAYASTKPTTDLAAGVLFIVLGVFIALSAD